MINLEPLTLQVDLGPHLNEIIKNAVEEAFAEQAELVKANPRHVTREEARQRIGISLPTLDKLIREGKIHTVKIGRRIHIVESSLNAYING